MSVDDELEIEYAFPLAGATYGLTLRDYFAARAPIQLYLTDSTVTFPSIREELMGLSAKYAYEWADAMMWTRKHGGRY